MTMSPSMEVRPSAEEAKPVEVAIAELIEIQPENPDGIPCSKCGNARTCDDPECPLIRTLAEIRERETPEEKERKFRGWPRYLVLPNSADWKSAVVFEGEDAGRAARELLAKSEGGALFAEVSVSVRR